MAAYRDAVPFIVFYAALFFALGVLMPFWPVFLEDRGLSNAEIGTLLAIGTWIKVVSNPLFGQLADRSQHPKRILVAMVLAALCGALVLSTASGFWAILLVYMVMFPAFQGLIPIGDSRALAVAAEKGFDYGRLRLAGSAAFLVAVLGLGEILEMQSSAAIPWALALAFGVLLIASTQLPAPRQTQQSKTLRGVPHLLSDRRFVLFLAIGALLQASHAVYYGFSAVYWTSIGFSSATVGWLWAEGVLAEIILFAFGKRVLDRIGPLGFLGIAAFAGIARWTMTATATDLTTLVVAQALHAGTFGAAHLGAMHFIRRYANLSLQATAQGVYTAATGGIGMGLAMLSAGTLFDIARAQAFLAMGGMSLFAGALVLLLAKRRPLKCATA